MGNVPSDLCPSMNCNFVKKDQNAIEYNNHQEHLMNQNNPNMLGNNLNNPNMINNNNIQVMRASSRHQMNIQKSHRMQPEIDINNNNNHFQDNRFEQQQLPPVDQEQQRIVSKWQSVDKQIVIKIQKIFRGYITRKKLKE